MGEGLDESLRRRVETLSEKNEAKDSARDGLGDFFPVNGALGDRAPADSATISDAPTGRALANDAQADGTPQNDAPVHCSPADVAIEGSSADGAHAQRGPVGNVDKPSHFAIHELSRDRLQKNAGILDWFLFSAITLKSLIS